MSIARHSGAVKCQQESGSSDLVDTLRLWPFSAQSCKELISELGGSPSNGAKHLGVPAETGRSICRVSSCLIIALCYPIPIPRSGWKVKFVNALDFADGNAMTSVDKWIGRASA